LAIGPWLRMYCAHCSTCAAHPSGCAVMQMKPRVFGLTIMGRNVRSPPRRIESFSNAPRCRPRAPRRNARTVKGLAEARGLPWDRHTPRNPTATRLWPPPSTNFKQWGRVETLYICPGAASGRFKCKIFRRDPIASPTPLPPPFGNGFGAAMSSAPWARLRNGDEDVATPFHV
jgi:hypothetical protein